MKRTSIAERLDAGGIASGGERVAGAVEQLLGQVPAGDGSLVEISTERIHVHPRNRKILDEDVADIVAGLKAGEPIINPLGVTAAADWNAGKPDDLPEIPPGDYMITAGGHRRLRAAEIAAVKTVPCIVRATFAGAAGRRSALLENVQRKDLDVFEQAEAIAELVADPYNMSQRDVAQLLGVNQSHVSKRLKLLKLPSTVRSSVRVGKLSIADALEFTRLPEELFSAAITRHKSSPWIDGKRIVDQVLDEHERTVKRQAEIDRLTGEGVKLADRAPEYYPRKTGKEPCRLTGLGFTPSKHKKEPCHAAYVPEHFYGRTPEVVWTCNAPSRHLGAKAESKLKATRTSSGAGRSLSETEKAQKKRRTDLRKTINPSRRAIVAQLLAGGFDAATRRDLVQQSVIFRLTNGGYSTSSSDLAIDLLGIRPSAERCYAPDVLRKHAEAAKPEQLAVVGAVTYFEGLTDDTYSFGDTVRWYLELLERNGYVITDVERETLGDIRQDDGTWSRRGDPLGDDPDPKCRVCFTYLDDLPAGVTQVAEDLCSACSDAQEAGWVAPDAPAHEVDPAAEVRRCVKCGCTDDAACDGGCTWVADNLCSVCSDVADEEAHDQLLEASEAVG